jgi:hypothetical protein
MRQSLTARDAAKPTARDAAKPTASDAAKPTASDAQSRPQAMRKAVANELQTSAL